ncbi:MAG: LegC family aminotransferase [Bacillota bacterium]|nr:LegC family aminotransferase [Bacillota bacterium]
MSKIKIPLTVPCLQGNEWQYIKECLDTGWVSSAGKYVDLFEGKIADYTGAKYAIACVNGTAALHIALLIAGVKPNDEVIVPTLTFISPVNTIKYCGANPVFMDADKFYNIDSDKTIEFIEKETELKKDTNDRWYTYNKQTKRKVIAIIPVHIFGNAVWLDDLYEICRERNIKIIEDATESLGTRYTEGIFAGRHTGTIGDLGCFSFNGNKIITTGGGGMIVTNNSKYGERAKYLTTQAKDDEVRYIHHEVGYNYRLTNIQAALGVAQLEQLPRFIETKRNNYNLYKNNIDQIEGLTLADVPEYAKNNYWLYALQVGKEYNKTRDELMEYLEEHGIQTRPVWYLNHMQRPYKNNYSYEIEHALKLYNLNSRHFIPMMAPGLRVTHKAQPVF